MATDPRDLLLKAEEEANQLVDVLTQLRTEIESYRTAHETLEDAAEAVKKVSVRCAAVASQLGSVANTLQTIGTPELLKGQQALAQALDTLQQRFSGQEEAFRDGLKTLEGVLDGHVLDLSGKVEALARETIMIRQELAQRDVASREKLDKLREDLETQLVRMTSIITFVRNLAAAGFGFLVLAALVLGWMLLSLG